MPDNTTGIAIAQINPVVCDLPGNAAKIADYCQLAEQQGAKIVLFPECVLSGYPIDDIAAHPGLYPEIERQLQQLAARWPQLYIMVGHPQHSNGNFYNALSILHAGRRLHCYHKQRLTNQGLFDERRQFSAGTELCLFTVDGINIAPAICEDIWGTADEVAPPIAAMRNSGAALLLTAHGSPYNPQRHGQRLANLRHLATTTGLPVACTHLVGGQDEFVFDGASVAVNADGNTALQAPQFREGLYMLYAERNGGKVLLRSDCQQQLAQGDQGLYQALVMATRDFVHKSGHSKVVLGLSGGIDSALTLCIAVDAIGAAAVTALLLPSMHTSTMSKQDADALARNLGVRSVVLPITDVHRDFTELLQAKWPCDTIDTADENLQARCRGMLLMAVANRSGALVLGTGNKSESAVGYSTLYGDTAAGFSPLGDVYKTQVYALAQWRQQHAGAAIPERTMLREPSAELKPGQLDQHSLPPYPELDEIVRLYTEENNTVQQIVDAGFDRQTVQTLLQRVEASEYKRRQCAPAPRVSHRSLQRERRHPVCSLWQRQQAQDTS